MDLVRSDGSLRKHPVMACARLLEEQQAQLTKQLAAGQAVTAAQRDAYLTLAGFAVALACELYKYEYGRLPSSAYDLVAEEYFNGWPGDPQADWQPLPLWIAFPLAHDQPASGPLLGSIVLAAGDSGPLSFSLHISGSSGLLLDYQSPATVWLETEAQLNGRSYLEYEQEMTRRYPDRALWPFSRIVEPAPAAPGLPSPRQEAAEQAGG